MTQKPIAPYSDNTGAVECSVVVWPGEAGRNQDDMVAKEEAVALVFNGVSHVVMMASPTQLQEFALGFSLTEGIINKSEDIYAIDIVQQEKGIEIALTISSQRFVELKNRRRNLAGRSGCGICGAESLEHVRLLVDAVEANFSLSHAAINRAALALAGQQRLQELTGAVHGAAWCDGLGNIMAVCEDVGRHNALDKLIGLLWSKNVLQQSGFLLITSRASYEIVQKAAKAGIAVVAAVSGPTSLAIDIADEVGITLIGFTRQDRHVVYTHSQRLTGED